MFNSFVSFILFLLSNALIQTVALQIMEECLLEPPVIKTVIILKQLAAGILQLLQKLICINFGKLFECLNRVPDLAKVMNLVEMT